MQSWGLLCLEFLCLAPAKNYWTQQEEGLVSAYRCLEKQDQCCAMSNCTLFWLWLCKSSWEVHCSHNLHVTSHYLYDMTNYQMNLGFICLCSLGLVNDPCPVKQTRDKSLGLLQIQVLSGISDIRTWLTACYRSTRALPKHRDSLAACSICFLRPSDTISSVSLVLLTWE